MDGVQVGYKVRNSQRLGLYSFSGDPSLEERNQRSQLIICDLIARSHASIHHLIKFLASSVPSMLILSITFDKVCHAENHFFDVLMRRGVEVPYFRCHLLRNLVSSTSYSFYKFFCPQVNLLGLNQLLFILVTTLVFVKKLLHLLSL